MSELKELIILGNGPSRVECKYHCETWGVNGGYGFAKRLDKLFMTDSLEGEVLTEEYNVEKLIEFNGSLVLAKHFPVFDGLGIPVEIYPIDEVLAKFPTRFYSNTIAYMIAYALLHTTIAIDPIPSQANPVHSSSCQAEPALTSPNQSMRRQSLPKVVNGYNKIWFFGIDMMSTSSYIQEKGGVEYWMGVALGLGVEVFNTRGSATGKTWDGKMYGYWGLQEEEQLKEKLYAPWEIIKVTKPEPVTEEWKNVDDNWIKVPVGTKKN